MQLLKRHPILLTISGLLLLSAAYITTNLTHPINRKQTHVGASHIVDKPTRPITAATWLQAINKQRQKHGIPPLVLDPRLNTSAERKRIEIEREPPQHNPHINQAGVQGYTYAQESTGCYTVAENIAPYFKSPKDTVTVWMHSPEHRAAILNPTYRATGFAWDSTTAIEHFSACS